MAAATYGDMQTRILDEVRDQTGSLTSQVQKAIQTAIARSERERFYFNTKNGSFSLVGGQEFYGAADYPDIPLLITIDSPMKVTLDGGSLGDINVESPDRIDVLQSGMIQGDPRFFCYVNETLRFFPIPATGRTVSMRTYVFRFAALVNVGDSNAWMTDGEELIRQRAKYILAMDGLVEFEHAARGEKMAKEAFDLLRAETRRRRSSPRLVTELPALIRPEVYDIQRGY